MFTTGGRLVRTIAVQPRLQEPASIGRPMGLLADGSVLVGAPVAEPGGTDGRQGQQYQYEMFLAVDTANQVTKTLGLVSIRNSGLKLAVVINGGRGEVKTGQPYSHDPLWHAARNGTTMVFVNRPQIPPGAPPKFTVTKVTSRGDTVFAVAFTYKPIPLDDKTFDEALANLKAGLPAPPGMTVEFDPTELRRKVYRPTHVPPASQVIAAVDGTIWIRREQTAASSSVAYTVLRANGTSLGELSFPKSDYMIEARGSSVWTKTFPTGDEEPSIHMYLVSRSGPALP